MSKPTFEQAINYIFGGKNRQARCKVAYLFFVELQQGNKRILSIQLPERLGLSQYAVHRVVHEFMKLGLIKEKGISKEEIKPTQVRFYEPIDDPIIQKIAEYTELIKILSESVEINLETNTNP